MFSIASDINFPRVPVSVIAIANIPVNGPGPKALKKIKLQIKKSIPLNVSNNRLNIVRTNLKGVTL